MKKTPVAKVKDTCTNHCVTTTRKKIKCLTSGGNAESLLVFFSSTDSADMVQPTLDTLQPSLEAMTPVLDELIEQLEASMKGSGKPLALRNDKNVSNKLVCV